LSISPGATPVNEANHVKEHANMWRMVDDVWDQWWYIPQLLEVAQGWYPYIAPGTWPDCDMIPLGRISIRGERGNDRMTRLTKDEQYSLMTLFTIFKSPLMFGGDLPSNDEFTLSLLTNSRVLKIHREGSKVRQVVQKDGKVAITSVNENTGEVYLALFNISNDPKPAEISVNLTDLNINGTCTATDLWSGSESGTFTGVFTQKIKGHASGLYSLKKR
jgi:hypothetical protein